MQLSYWDFKRRVHHSLLSSPFPISKKNCIQQSSSTWYSVFHAVPKFTRCPKLYCILSRWIIIQVDRYADNNSEQTLDKKTAEVKPDGQMVLYTDPDTLKLDLVITDQPVEASSLEQPIVLKRGDTEKVPLSVFSHDFSIGRSRQHSRILIIDLICILNSANFQQSPSCAVWKTCSCMALRRTM